MVATVGVAAEKSSVQIKFEPITLERVEQVAEPGVRVTKDGANTIVAIFAGEKRTGGYSVKVTGVEKRGHVCTVNYRIDTPPPGAIVTQAITYPHQAVRIQTACSKVELNPPLPSKRTSRPDR